MSRVREIDRSARIQPQAIKDKMKKMALTVEATAKVLNMPQDRFRDCLAHRKGHRFTEAEIIDISIKLAMRMTELLEDPADIPKYKELKRIAVSDLKMMKYYTKWHRQEPPKPEDCSKMKSPAEIVKKDRRKYEPMKTASLPQKPDDPNKTYIIDSMGTKVLSEEVRNGVKIMYRTI